jgi:hypothetical protein
MDILSPGTKELSDRISDAALGIEDKVIAWRRGSGSRRLPMRSPPPKAHAPRSRCSKACR